MIDFWRLHGQNCTFSQIRQTKTSILVKNCMLFLGENSNMIENYSKNLTFRKILPLQLVSFYWMQKQEISTMKLSRLMKRTEMMTWLLLSMTSMMRLVPWSPGMNIMLRLTKIPLKNIIIFQDIIKNPEEWYSC